MQEIPSQSKVLEAFSKLDAAVKPEVERLYPFLSYQGKTRDKGRAVKEAMDRLGLAITQLYNISKDAHPSLKSLSTSDKLDIERLKQLDLSTIEGLLNAEIRIWEDEDPPSIIFGEYDKGSPAGYKSQLTLKQALNIARWNPFNVVFGSTNFGPLWGESDTLIRFKHRLENADKK